MIQLVGKRVMLDYRRKSQFVLKARLCSDTTTLLSFRAARRCNLKRTYMLMLSLKLLIC